MFASGTATSSSNPPIPNSLRFRSAASAYLSRTFGTPTSANIFTLSGWAKKTANGVVQYLFTCTDAGTHYLAFDTTDKLLLVFNNVTIINTSAVFRDPAAWYHIMWVQNGSSATLYVNGVSVGTGTGTPTASTFNANGITHRLWARYWSGGPTWTYTDGYLSRICFVDGSALTPSSFGYTDATTNQWVSKSAGACKAVVDAGGTNSFMLEFNDGTSTTALGNDYSSKNNDWTSSGHSVTAGVTYDWMTDTPTNNFATLNPVDVAFGVSGGNTLSNGALGSVAPAAQGVSQTTTRMPSGKWYFEATRGAVGTTLSANYVGFRASGTIGYYAADGSVGSVTGTAGATYTTNDVIGVAVDRDAGTIEFFKNGTTQGGSRTLTTYNDADSSFVVSGYNAGAWNVNFGQRPFTYTPPTGYKSLCTANLPAPTIKNPKLHFDVAKYTGTGASLNVTVDGNGNSLVVAPDLAWVKNRGVGNSHVLVDTIRGVNNCLVSNATDAEATIANTVTAFLSNGITVNNTGNTGLNTNTYAAWLWKAGGAGSANSVTGTGAVAGTTSANTTAGFSISTFTAQTSGVGTFTHGLGVAPSFVIIKGRTGTVGWNVWHSALANTEYILMNSTAAKVTAATNRWNSTSPSSTTVTLGSDWAGLGTQVAYVFAEVPGFSKFGSYTGNGNADGPFVYCGFRPRFVLLKCTSAVGSWDVFDSTRNTSNLTDLNLYANVTDAEGASVSHCIDILSNGFKIRGTGANINAAQTYIFAAFAETPFQYSSAR